MNTITFEDVGVFIFVVILLAIAIVFGIGQIRECNEGMRTLKQIDKELSEMSDEPPKEET